MNIKYKRKCKCGTKQEMQSEQAPKSLWRRVMNKVEMLVKAKASKELEEELKKDLDKNKDETVETSEKIEALCGRTE